MQMYLNLYQKYIERGLCDVSVTRPGENYTGCRVNERQQAATIIFVEDTPVLIELNKTIIYIHVPSQI